MNKADILILWSRIQGHLAFFDKILWCHLSILQYFSLDHIFIKELLDLFAIRISNAKVTMN